MALIAVTACTKEPEPVGRVVVDPSRLELAHGTFVPIELTWTMESPLPDGDETLVFAHLVDGEGTVRRTFDHRLPGGWVAGETRTETVPIYHSAIGPALPAGTYDLVVGIVDGAGERWPLAADGRLAGHLEYALTSVEVPELDPGTSHFVFEGSWLPVEAGTDVQVVARRWLEDQAAIQVSGLPAGAQELGLVLRIPAGSDGLRFVPDEGSDQPSVLVSTDCSGFEAQVTGPGIHEIRVPVEWGTESCRLRFAPSFHMVEIDSLRRIAVSLEQLGYR